MPNLVEFFSLWGAHTCLNTGGSPLQVISVQYGILASTIFCHAVTMK